MVWGLEFGVWGLGFSKVGYVSRLPFAVSLFPSLVSGLLFFVARSIIAAG
jgi:hypothetical protein